MSDEGEIGTRACPVCRSTRSGGFLEKEGLVLVRCRDCSMVFVVNTGPEFTGGKFYETEGSAFYSSEDKIAGDYSPVRYLREVRLLRRFCPGGRVLDVGCSTGGFLYALRQRFPDEYAVTGNDVAFGALDVAAQRGVPVARESFFSLPKPPEGYDAITLWAVLEHVGEPSAFLQRAHDLLRPGGLCFILVPNLRSLAFSVLGAKYRYILPQHLNYFSRQTLARIVLENRFAVIYSTTTHFNPLVIVQDFRSRGRFVPDRKRAELLVKTNSLKRHPALLPIRWLYDLFEKALGLAGLADNVVVVGRRDH